MTPGPRQMAFWRSPRRVPAPVVNAARLTMSERVEAFKRAFPEHPAAWPMLTVEQGRTVAYATWVGGQDYRNRSRFYGAYPHGYLARVMALFPDVVARMYHAEIPLLHVFSGSLPSRPQYLRCDLRQDAELPVSVYALAEQTAARFPLIIADPPYSKADAVKYGTPMIDRRRALAALARVAEPGGHLVWLDQVWPQHAKRDWTTVGRITLVRSTNHRVRVAHIFERQ